MNLVVTGSRDWPEDEPDMIFLVLDRVFWGNHREEPYHVHVGYDPKHRRPSGVDRIVYEKMKWVNEPRSFVPVKLHTYPADWDRYGKKAGVIRNAEMLRTAESGLVVAFHASPDHYLDLNRKAQGKDGPSGTNHCARLAERMRTFEVVDLIRNPRG
jgi:hypothetical protein